jgi:N-acetylneuraminic acid mutarotase
MKFNNHRTRKFILPALMIALAGASLIWAPFRPVQAQGNTWTTKANMPTGRSGLAAAEINGKLYAVGGTNSGVLQVYDPQTNSWMSMASMPTARGFLAAAAIDGKLYVVGGLYFGTPQNALQVYDPQTNTWTNKASMPTARGSLAAAVIDGKLYAVGGTNGSNTQNSKLEVYDPQTDTWTTKANMPTVRSGLAAVAIDGKLYVAGGLSGIYFNRLEVYDPQTDTWAAKANMPTSREGLAAAVIGGQLYVVGGENGNGIRSELEVYNPQTDTWSIKAGMNFVRSFLAAAAVDGLLYAVGGLPTFNGNRLEAYQPDTNSAPVALTKNITVSAVANCMASITAAQVNNGSYDPDGDGITLSLDSTGPFGLGNHTVTLTVTDSNGASSSATATVTVVDTTNPTLTCPDNIVVYLPLNSMDTAAVVNYAAPTASDCSSVTITTSKASGTVFPLGATTVNITATDAAGNQSACSFTVSVRYNFSGFLQPVDPLPMVNGAKAGSAIPVKFSLSGNKGMRIFAAGFPASQQLACGSGKPSELEDIPMVSASGLSYTASSDTYTYVWKTDKAWAGTCRQLLLKLNDGTTHVAHFQFK